VRSSVVWSVEKHEANRDELLKPPEDVGAGGSVLGGPAAAIAMTLPVATVLVFVLAGAVDAALLELVDVDVVPPELVGVVLP